MIITSLLHWYFFHISCLFTSHLHFSYSKQISHLVLVYLLFYLTHSTYCIKIIILIYFFLYVGFLLNNNPLITSLNWNIFLFFKNLHIVILNYLISSLWRLSVSLSPLCAFIIIFTSLICLGGVLCLLSLLVCCFPLWVSNICVLFLKIFYFWQKW